MQASKRKLRVAAILFTLLLIATLTAALIWPRSLEWLPEPLLSIFRSERSAELPMHMISGTVTFDGVPIEEGEVRFVPLDKKLNPDIAKIRKGRYLTQVKEGEHTVEIRGLAEVDTQFLPARYNVATELRFEAKQNGEEHFKLHSDRK